MFENWHKRKKVSVSFASLWYYLNVDNPGKTVANCWRLTPAKVIRYTRTHELVSNKARWKLIVPLSLRCDKKVLKHISNICMRRLYFNVFLWETACPIHLSVNPIQWFCCFSPETSVFLNTFVSSSCSLKRALPSYTSLPRLLTATNSWKMLPCGDTSNIALKTGL